MISSLLVLLILAAAAYIGLVAAGSLLLVHPVVDDVVILRLRLRLLAKLCERALPHVPCVDAVGTLALSSSICLITSECDAEMSLALAGSLLNCHCRAKSQPIQTKPSSSRADVKEHDVLEACHRMTCTAAGSPHIVGAAGPREGCPLRATCNNLPSIVSSSIEPDQPRAAGQMCN